MKKITFLLLFAAVTITAFSCRTRTTRKAMRHGEVLKSNIDNFEENRQKLSTKLVASLEEAKASLSAENPDIPEVSKDFEKQWRSIMGRYKKLKGDFEDVGNSSTKYFEQLNELSGNINNDDLRKQELGKNKALEVKWQKTYDKANASILKVTEVLESGNDFHMVLVASSIRQKLEQNVDELNNISEQAKILLSDLEVFTEAGRSLVAGEG